MKLLLGYILIISIVTFVLYGLDKYRAIHHEYRISEATLLTCSAIGGSFGAALGMILFHHKTRKTKFRLLVPLCLIVHVILLILILR